MIPRKVWGVNYALYERVEWSIPEGVTAILGRNEGEGINSNGAGKTRLLELLPLALWGPSSSWADYASGDGVCEVGCEFEHAGDVFQVRRTYSPAGRGKTTLDFERLPGAGMTITHSLTRESQAATQQAIRDLLGIGEETFHQSVFSAQSTRHFAEPTLTPKERAEILADGLGLDEWDTFKAAVAEDRKALEAEHDALIVQLGQYRQELDAREDVAKSATVAEMAIVGRKEMLDAARAKHERLDAQYRAARDAQEQLDAARREMDAHDKTAHALEREHDEAQAAKAMIPALQATIQQGEAKAAKIPSLEAEIGAINEHAALRDKRAHLVKQRDNHEAQAKQHDYRAKKLEGQADEREEQATMVIHGALDHCDRCGQTLKGDALRMAAASLRDEARRLLDDAAKAKADASAEREIVETYAEQINAMPIVPEPDDERHAALARELTEARAAERNLAIAKERLHNHQAAIDKAESNIAVMARTQAREAFLAAQQRVQALQAAVRPEEEIAVLARDVVGAQLGVEVEEKALAEAHAAAGAARERLRVIDEVAAKNADAVAREEALRFDVEVLRTLEHAYGRSGIPVLLLESLYVPRIEFEANRVLDVWGVPFSVELMTQRELKGSDRLRDTLEVAVHSPDGVRSFRTFSGGERSRISTALRIALARVISSSRGASLGVFALDEVQGLDAAGVEKLGELLVELQREIPVVLFVSHQAELSDAFDQRVVVVREGGRSRLEIAA